MTTMMMMIKDGFVVKSGRRGKGVSPHGKAAMLFDPAVADDDGDDDGDDGCGDDDRDLGGNDVSNQCK